MVLLDRRKKVESNSVDDGCSHILHTFNWFDNEWHMQIGIDDIRRLCKFFTATLSATISYRSFVGAFPCLSSFVCSLWYVLCILIEYSSNYSSFKIDGIILRLRSIELFPMNFYLTMFASNFMEKRIWQRPAKLI